MTKNSGKFRRQEEQLTNAQRRTIYWLIDNGYGIESVMERFGLSEMAALEYVNGPRNVPTPKWQVRWDDSEGNRHVKVCEGFNAAREYHAALQNVEWSRIERV